MGLALPLIGDLGGAHRNVQDREISKVAVVSATPTFVPNTALKNDGERLLML